MQQAAVGPAEAQAEAPPPAFDAPPPPYDAAPRDPEAQNQSRIVRIAGHMASAAGGMRFRIQRENGQHSILPFSVVRGAGVDALLRYVERSHMTPRRLYAVLIQTGAAARPEPPAYAAPELPVEYDVDEIVDHAYYATGEVLFSVRWADGTTTEQPFCDIKGTADDAFLRYVEAQNMTARSLYDLLIHSGAAD